MKIEDFTIEVIKFIFLIIGLIFLIKSVYGSDKEVEIK